MFKLNLTALILLPFFSFAFEAASLVLKNSVEIIDQSTFAPESVSISDDGTLVCWIGKEQNSKLVIPSELYFKQLNSETIVKFKKGNMLNAFTKCSFDHQNNLVTSKLHWKFGALQKTLISGLFTGELEPKGYNTSISVYNQAFETILRLNPKNMGFNSNRVYIKHPRFSPDGKWVAFYLYNKDKEVSGVFLYHLESKRLHQLSNDYDKHPTWSPDGKKILFHYQINQSKNHSEMAFLGYFDLKLNDNGDVLNVKRHLLDNPKFKPFSYEKHPAMIAGTNFIIYHAEAKSGDKKALYIRKLEVNSTPIELKLELADGTKITKAKHPATGALTNNVVFIGKPKGANEDMVLKLTDKAMREIVQLIK
jgi:hypothetical protein